ncbi:S9 family peptidase [Catalinimonas sp. 4WD22]|uniref:S9 family peptidase n=1 Tax=Catalinimonas locisalis TaxID=3133978 RepID=UPI0031017618
MTQIRKIPVRDFFRNPEKSGFDLSPNGEYISFLAPFQDRMNIHVQKIGEDNVKRITSVTERDIAGYFWADDNRIVYLRDNGGDENYYLTAIDKDGNNEKTLTQFDNVRTQLIDDLEDFPDEVIIGLNKRNPEVFDAYRLNLVSGEMEMIAENPGNIVGWLTDHNGALRVAMTSDGVNTTLLHRETEEQEFKPLLTTNFKESASPLFFTFDNRNLFATSNLGRDKSAIVILDTTTGKEAEKIFEHPEVDVSSLSYSKKRKVLTGIAYTTWKTERTYLDEEAKKRYEWLKEKLGEVEIAITSYNKNEDKFIVRTYSDRTLGSYYFYDQSAQTLEKLIEVSPWLKADEMAEMKPVTYQSRDGLTIHGYLTLPLDKKDEKLPLVVNPHGGPWVRDSWGFNPEVQFLANRGYAVLQMNYRGSTGYGRDFWEASFKQWGLKMQDDISDGVKYLIDEGIADPKKVAIYGGSYGGYATLAGLTFTPDLYACGVDYVGVSNLFTFMQTIPPYWKPMLEMMYEMVGHPEDMKEQFEKTSPALQAHKIKAPLLIAQGAKDPRVNKAESDQIVQALKERGIDVDYLVKDNEGHGFHNEENRFEFYEEMEKFLAKHLA